MFSFIALFKYACERALLSLPSLSITLFSLSLYVCVCVRVSQYLCICYLTCFDCRQRSNFRYKTGQVAGWQLLNLANRQRTCGSHFTYATANLRMHKAKRQKVARKKKTKGQSANTHTYSDAQIITATQFLTALCLLLNSK